MGSLHGLGQHGEIVSLPVFPLEVHALLRPRQLDEFDGFGHPLAALLAADIPVTKEASET